MKNLKFLTPENFFHSMKVEGFTYQMLSRKGFLFLPSSTLETEKKIDLVIIADDQEERLLFLNKLFNFLKNYEGTLKVKSETSHIAQLFRIREALLRDDEVSS